jgi:hypothetical protein
MQGLSTGPAVLFATPNLGGIFTVAVSNIGAGEKAPGPLAWITTSYLLITAIFLPLTD